MDRLVMLGIRVVAVVVLGLVVSPGESLTCASQKFTNKVYANCADLPYLGAYLHWNYNASSATLSIAFQANPPQANGWVAWGINPTSTKMAGSQALLAYKSNGSPIVKTYNISSYNFASAGTKLTYDVSDLSSENSDSTITIFATWRLPEKREEVNHVWQVGPVSQGLPGLHVTKGDNLRSFGVLELLPSSGSTDWWRIWALIFGDNVSFLWNRMFSTSMVAKVWYQHVNGEEDIESRLSLPNIRFTIFIDAVNPMKHTPL